MTEERLWRAAEVLRGSVDALAYKDLVLGLLLLRWPGELATPVPWAALRGASAAELDGALAAMEAATPALAGALPARFVASGVDAGRLAALHAVVDEGEEGGNAAVYERLLARFSREAGRGGEFYTPPGVVAVLRALVPPTGRIYDPCCGMGGLLDGGPGGSGGAGEVWGQESNPATWRLARVQLARRGIVAHLGARAADSLRDDLHPDQRFDVAWANPPFNQAAWGRDELRDDPRWVYGLPPASNANFAWIQHVLAHLAPDGRAAVVTANGALTAGRGGEGEIRRRLVASGRVHGIVALPEQLFLTTIIPATVWVLGPPTGWVTFVDATGLGRRETRARRVLDEGDVAAIREAWECARRGGEAAIARSVPIAPVLDGGALLTPGRHLQGEGGARAAPHGGEVAAAARELAEALDAARAGEDRLRQALRELGVRAGSGDP